MAKRPKKRRSAADVLQSVSEWPIVLKNSVEA